MSRAFAPRFEARGEIQMSRSALGTVRQKTPTARGRRNTSQSRAGSPGCRCVHHSSREDCEAVGRDHRHALERRPESPVDQAAETASVRIVHLPETPVRPLRQQSRGTRHSPCGNHPQKQLLQPKRTRCRRSSRSNECLSNTHPARPSIPSDNRTSTNDLPCNRTTSPASRQERRIWVISYETSNHRNQITNK